MKWCEDELAVRLIGRTSPASPFGEYAWRSQELSAGAVARQAVDAQARGCFAGRPGRGGAAKFVPATRV